MKKVRLFATISIFSLGIAAVATTQAHSKTIFSGFRPDNSGNCTVEITAACSDETTIACTDPSDGAPLYAFNTGACVTQLFKKP